MKDLLKYLLMILLLLGVFARIVSASVDERRSQLLQIVDEELAEISRLSKQISHRNPNLLVRMAELYTEKGRLLKELENEKFLQLTSQQRQKRNKKDFFKDSRKWFVRAQKISRDVLVRFSNIKEKADVYYILAYNAKEFDRNQEAKKYFNMSRRFSTKRSDTRLKANLELANIYFNEREYSKAIPIYESTLGIRAGHDSNRWWTKDAFNLAWCYFRVDRFSKAINLMRKIYSKSSQNEYIDMREMVLRDLPLFYAMSDRINDGIAFYQSVGRDIGKYLKQMVEVLIEQGKDTRAQKVIDQGLKYSSTDRHTIELTTLQIDLYLKYFKVNNHLARSNVLMSYYRKGMLNAHEVERLKFNAQTMGAKLQKQIIGKAYRKIRKIKEMKALQAADYFEMLAELEPSESHKMIYYQAETLYAAGLTDKALDSYHRTYEKAVKGSISSYVKLSIDGMMACLASNGTSNAYKEKFYLPVYEAFLKRDSQSKEANQIYQKLFKIHFERKNIPGAVGVLDEFKSNFPADITVQEAMITEVIEYYRSRKQYDETRTWIQKIIAGQYRVGGKYFSKVKEILTGLQMMDAQNAIKSGNKKQALDYYKMVATNPSSTPEARRSANYNIALMYLELGALKDSKDWALKAINEMSSKEILRFESTFLTISTELFNQMYFNESSLVSKVVLEKICGESSTRKNVLFKNAAVINLADGKLKEALRIIHLGEKCKIPDKYVDDVKFEFLEEMIEKKKWKVYTRYLDDLSKRKANWGKLIKYLDVYCSSEAIEPTAKNGCYHKMNKYYDYAKKNKESIPLESLDVIAEYRLKELYRLEGQLDLVKLAFPEKTYHNRLRQKFHLLDRLTDNALGVFEIGSGKGIVDAYKCLIKSYIKIAQELRSYTPPGKSNDYVAAFKKDMEKMSMPLLTKAEENDKRAITQISKFKILSDSSWEFLGRRDLPLRVRFLPKLDHVIMDRRGGK